MLPKQELIEQSDVRQLLSKRTGSVVNMSGPRMDTLSKSLNGFDPTYKRTNKSTLEVESMS